MSTFPIIMSICQEIFLSQLVTFYLVFIDILHYCVNALNFHLHVNLFSVKSTLFFDK